MAEQAAADEPPSGDAYVCQASSRRPHDARAHGRAGGTVGASLHARPAGADPRAPGQRDRRRSARPDRARTGPRDQRPPHRPRHRLPDGPRPSAPRFSWRSGTPWRPRGVDRSSASLLATAVILSVPLVAMLVTGEVAWGPGDFVAAGALVAGYRPPAPGGGEEGRRSRLPRRRRCRARDCAPARLDEPRRRHRRRNRAGSPMRMSVGVLAVGIAGAVAARLRPEGMTRALLATALVQALAAGIALIAGEHQAQAAPSPRSSCERVLRRPLRRIGVALRHAALKLRQAGG